VLFAFSAVKRVFIKKNGASAMRDAAAASSWALLRKTAWGAQSDMGRGWNLAEISALRAKRSTLNF